MPNNRRMNPRLTEDVSGLLAVEEAGLQSATVELRAATAAKGQAQSQERTAKRVRATAHHCHLCRHDLWSCMELSGFTPEYPISGTTATANPEQPA